MCYQRTICCIQSVIILQTLFCVNRSFLLHGRRKKIFCNLIFVVCFICVCVGIIYNFTQIPTTNIFQVIFQFVIYFEAIYIACVSRYHVGLFAAVTRLDEKCFHSDEYFATMNDKALKLTIITIYSVILEVVGMIALGIPPTTAVIMTVAFSAHDAEITLISLLVDGFNLRLAALDNVRPSYGVKVYRHVLASASYLKEEYDIRILLMLAVTLFTTTAYAVVIFLAEEIIWKVIFYLMWREFRSLYSLWLLCSAAVNTDKICKRLVLHLAKRLVFEFKSSEKTLACQITHRWYVSAKTSQPKYVNSTSFPIDLTVPLNILDLSCNYLLIIVQIYVFYRDG